MSSVSGYAIGEKSYLGGLPSGDNWSLETDSQDIAAHSLGELQEGASGVYSFMGEGEYIEVWATVYRAPWNLNSVYERVS